MSEDIYVPTPNIEKFKKIQKAIEDNEGYCPCVLIKNDDTRCVCKEMREEGNCRCGLYIAKVERDK